MNALLQAEGISVTLPGASGPERIFGPLALTLHPGEVVDLTGPSGSGKTTLLRALARLLPHLEGELVLGGVRADDIAPEQWRARVTLVPQLPKMWPGTVGENLTLPWRLKVRAAEDPPHRQALLEALAEVGLAEIPPERDASRLSVGQQARVSLLRASLAKPSVLLLDEPDANLDDEAAAEVASYVRRFADGGGTVLRVRHLPRGDAPDRRLRLAAGGLADVRPEEAADA